MSFCFTAMLFLSQPILALDWACTHGHSGNIEYVNRVETLDRVHIGWGLQFDQKSGLVNWIHFAPPSSFGQKTRYVALQFSTGSVDAFIDNVDIYDLGVKVKQFTNLGWSGPQQIQILDLGEEMTFTALGISVEVKAGVESMSHEFTFNGACASK
ncbi:hypothetical protein [Methyloprofundus sedimenti]|nr:hypothetical protein [Methyloprofundus sedimenti]